MPKRAAKTLNMNIDAKLLERIEKFRFKQMFQSRSEAIEFLLDIALRSNPQRSKDGKTEGE